MQPQFVNQVLAFVAGSQAALQKAAQEISRYQQADKRAHELQSPTLRHLMQHGLVLDEQQKEAAEMLVDHAGTLQLLKLAVDRIAQLKSIPRQKQAQDQGQAVPDSMLNPVPNVHTHSTYDSLNDNYVGRRTGEGVKKASDLAYETILMS